MGLTPDIIIVEDDLPGIAGSLAPARGDLIGEIIHHAIIVPENEGAPGAVV